METQNDDIPGRTTVRLPGCMTTVTLPLPPNFLHVKHGEGTMPLADVSAIDATLLGMAMSRQLVRHWRKRNVQLSNLSPSEAAQFDDAPMLHEAIVDAIARKTIIDSGRSWSAMTGHQQDDVCSLTRAIIDNFLEEMNRE